MQSKPPEACSVEPAATTAMMVRITSTGGLPGGRPNQGFGPNIITIKPMPENKPRNIPPRGAEMKRNAISRANWNQK